ncbi:hypothetical protein [Neisseria wadsworthii]|uniref:hypothetical protein n=1 Tax=Neisseria wadsworthii TaxID=607711 RepID=UPI0015F44A77|nr:hypothetical protein [Neisseria wadsworthii]QMT34805.1 hypothetical protein H3L96_06885 [Neisseria wadsworthii]
MTDPIEQSLPADELIPASEFVRFLQGNGISELKCPVCGCNNHSYVESLPILHEELQHPKVYAIPCISAKFDNFRQVIYHLADEAIKEANAKGTEIPNNLSLYNAIFNTPDTTDAVLQNASTNVILLTCQSCGYIMNFNRFHISSWLKQHPKQPQDTQNGEQIE